MNSPGLTWILVAGKPSHVSRFAGVPPRRRPAATCPECGRRLTLKLGRVRRHHAAHAPRDRCIATRPETALHIDLKLHLASRLEAAIGSGLPLVIHRRCPGAAKGESRPESCDATHEHAWMLDWDEVVVEARVASATGTRPDILLRRGGQILGVIEVLVSHAVSDDKAASFAAARCPWIEVRGDATLVDGETAWSAARPLPVEREGTSVSCGPWRCPTHERAHRNWSAEAAAQRTAEMDASRHQTVLRGARVVDIYHPGGGRDRLIYRVDEQLVDGSVCALTLRRGTREVASEPAEDAPGAKRDAWKALRPAYSADVERLTLPHGAFADSPMRWASGDAAENLLNEALFDLVPGDSTPLATRYPRRWFFARERGEWFLPPDMRQVRWDRDEYDVFAAHPAWAAGRAAVRERPAPAEAWNTFVFASRPSPAAFGSGVRVVADGNAAVGIAVLDLERVVSAESGQDQQASPRVLVVVTAPTANDEVRRVARSLDDAGVEQLWLSHPRDWDSSRADLAWAPAGRDGRGRGVVVVDGLGVYRAEQFVRAFARGERRVAPEAIRSRLAERVAQLRFEAH